MTSAFSSEKKVKIRPINLYELKFSTPIYANNCAAFIDENDDDVFSPKRNNYATCLNCPPAA